MRAISLFHRLNPCAPLSVAFFLTLLSLVYFINLGRLSLSDPNESLNAETSREMFESGDYVVPRFNYQVVVQRPPLTYWLVCLSYRFFGVNELSARLPGAIAGIGILLFTFGIGVTLFGVRAGILAAAMTALTARVFILARRLSIDVLLIFFLMGAAFFLIRGILRRSTLAWALTYLFAGLGFLTEGPIALVIPAAACLLWVIRAREKYRGGTHLGLGLLILAAVLLPWLAVALRTHDLARIPSLFLAKSPSQSIGDPARGLLFYVPVYLVDFFPWSVLSLPALYILWQNRKRPAPAWGLPYGFPAAWCLSVFVLSSFSKNRQDYCIAPLYPMMSILVAAGLERFYALAASEASNRERALLLRTFLVTSVFGVALALLPAFIPGAIIADVPPVLRFVPSVLFLLASAALGWNALRGSVSGSLASIVVSLLAAYMVFCIAFVPAMEPSQPVKKICREIQAAARPGDEAGYFRMTVPGMAFYLQRPIFEEYDADTMVQRFRSGRRIFCVLSEKDYDYFVGRRDLILYVLDRHPRAGVNLRAMVSESVTAEQELLLASNMPDQESGAHEGRETP